MPELAEVETLKRQLNESGLIGLKVTRAENVLGFRLRDEIPSMMPFVGAKLLQIGRRGKYLGFIFDNGLTLISHLGMSGMWTKVKKEYQASAVAQKHKAYAFHFAEQDAANRCILMYSDPRRFGMCFVIKSEDTQQFFEDKQLGYEPLNDEFTPQVLTYLLSYYPSNMKKFLMDQTQIAGLGNIYASEVLWRAKVYPGVAASQCRPRAALLCSSIKEVLTEAIKHGGSTIHTYSSLDGGAGEAQKYHHVYGREGLQCYRTHECAGRILKSDEFDKRSTYYCPYCQSA